jgi:cyclin-dependent kinase 1
MDSTNTQVNETPLEGTSQNETPIVETHILEKHIEDTPQKETPIVVVHEKAASVKDTIKILPQKRLRKSDNQLILEKALFGENHKEILYTRTSNGKGNIIFYDGKKEVLVQKKGSGANGTVMEATFFHDNSKIAIKIGERNNILREYSCISRLNNNRSPKNVIKNVLPCVEYNDLAALIMPSYDTDLAHVINDSSQSLSNDHIKCILKHILRGLAHSHALGIIHADLKPANILVQVNPLECVIADFGLAQKNIGPLSLHVVSRWFRAPEIIKEDTYSFPIDIWSFGCILFELVTRKVLFNGTACGNLSPCDNKPIPLDTKGCMMDLIHNNDANKELSQMCITQNYDSELLDLFIRCIEIDPSKRITAKDALNHPFFVGKPSFPLPPHPSRET